MVKKLLYSGLLSLLFFPLYGQKNAQIPNLEKKGEAIQLMVEGAPFLILGGELGNSSASNMDYMEPVWPKLVQMNLNTVLAPIYWELIEPTEGDFNFGLVDSLIMEARQHDLKLVFLWFGSWKNSMSCYAPIWVKKDYKRFPRARDSQGKAREILSPFSENSLKADKTAFKALMKHIKDFDERQQTVIMVQVENEIAMIPSARDHSKAANEAYRQEVPRALMDYLGKHEKTLQAGLRDAWVKNGKKASGTWEEVFGKGLSTEELFMAWHYARFTNAVAQAGKEVYPLPMYVNAALNRPNLAPGEYPSGGPLPHLIDVWKTAAPTIDFLSPDIYFPDYEKWVSKYSFENNPLFVPEVRLGEANGVQALYTFGKFNALGYSPFSIESTANPEQANLTKSYHLLRQLTPLILEKQRDNKTFGVLVDQEKPQETIKLKDYTLMVAHDYTLGWSAQAKDGNPWPKAGGIIVVTGENDFFVAGDGLVITIKANDSEMTAGFASIFEGEFIEGEWKAGRSMNGDQSHQGRHVRIPVGTWGIQKVSLYQYK